MAAEEVSLPSEEAETVSVAAEEISQAPEEINFAAYSNAFSGDHGTKLADSGLTAGWLFETLLNNSWEFHDALGSGNVEEVRCSLHPCQFCLGMCPLNVTCDSIIL